RWRRVPRRALCAAECRATRVAGRCTRLDALHLERHDGILATEGKCRGAARRPVAAGAAPARLSAPATLRPERTIEDFPTARLAGWGRCMRELCRRRSRGGAGEVRVCTHAR